VTCDDGCEEWYRDMSSPETGKFGRKAGRREIPLPDDGKPRTVLAAQLRELKSACGGPTYDELAGLSRVYKTGLLDAARVTRLPPWYVIEGYVIGCWKYYEGKFSTPFAGAGNLSQWQQLYRNAGGTMPGECPPHETGERDEQPEPQLALANGDVATAHGVTQAQGAAEPAPRLTHARQARIGGGHSRPNNVLTGMAAVVVLIAAAVAVIVGSVIGVAWLLRPAPAGPWTRLAVQPVDSGYRHQLAATTIPATSLRPKLAQWLGRRIATGGSVTGYELRSAYPVSPPLCLTAVTDSLTAGQDGSGVQASPCSTSARSQIWIPVQYEAIGSSYTWLVNDQYQSMCLNADNRRGGVHQESRVQLWSCYLPRRDDFTRFNESWDFGTWLHAMQSGAISYPLFLGAGNYSLDADDRSLQGGLPAAPLSIINHYTVSWEYWY
jgi:hypothetical protein